jgi:hypothetical protein
MSNSRESKAIFVTSRGASKNFKMSRLQILIDDELIDGSDVVSLKCRPRFTPMKNTGTQDLRDIM